MHHHVILLTILGSATGTTAINRTLIYMSKSMPKLPPNAGFWAQFFYNIMKGASGLDPNATILTPGEVSKIMGKVPNA